MAGKPQTHCVKGHELTDDNVILSKRGDDARRWCKTCKQEANHKARVRRYRVAPKVWAAMLEEQGGMCPTCDRSLPAYPYLSTRTDGSQILLCALCVTGVKKTHCKNGHEFTVENVAVGKNGKRKCLACQREAVARWRELNFEKGLGQGGFNAAKTHCAKGHPYDEGNTSYAWVKATGRPRRICNTCTRDKNVVQRFKKYGLTEADFYVLLSKQGGVCAICEQDFGGEPHIDHDHAVGHEKVRGLLCSYCNQGLGQFRDNKEILLKAAAYLP